LFYKSNIFSGSRDLFVIFMQSFTCFNQYFPMQDVLIMPATPPERDWAGTLLAGSEPWLTLGIGLEQCLRTCHDPEYEVYIAHTGDVPCGVMVLDPRGMAGAPYIKSVAVSEGSRNLGVGALLLAFTESVCRSRSKHLFLCVSSFNTAARRFYETHGFTLVGELPDYIVQGASELILHKALL
jgi:ribosomal protein S18 acetylase RimI-like enzyme